MLAGKNYVPILRTRISEVEAFRNLSAEAKELIFPVFLLRPWPNANNLQLTVDRIADALDGHSFGLGLDSEKKFGDNSKNAQKEFDDLFSENQGFANYFQFIADIPGAIPVLQPSGNADQILIQFGRADDLNRGLIVHQQKGAALPISQSLIGLPPMPDDTMFVVDAGWSRDTLQMQSWALQAANQIYDSLPDAEIVVASSSFPDAFGHIVGTDEEPAYEGDVFSAVRTRLQGANTTLGDWGSTRPSQNGGGGRIPSRIDLPRPNSWQIFRADPSNDSGYAPLAGLATAHAAFASIPECWGKLQVEATDGSGTGIKGVKSNTSARINMHMTIKSGASGGIGQDEQPYVD